MLKYPLKATTAKNINKFTYSLYLAATVNKIKYNNDSSATIRLLSCLIDSNDEILEDIPYAPNFKLNNLEFITVNRVNGFSISAMPEIIQSRVDDIIFATPVSGFSKYTNKQYLMKQVESADEFFRHSFPCDAFLTEFTSLPGSVLLEMHPRVKFNMSLAVPNTAVTIRLAGGFYASALSEGFNNITLVIEGLDVSNKKVEERIDILNVADVQTDTEFSYISSILSIGTDLNCSIILYPYINGEVGQWEYLVVDKVEGDFYRSFASIDTVYKQLQISISANNAVTYPPTLDLYKTVDLALQANETITNYFIDTANKLAYITTDTLKLYCFPLIIPKTYAAELDINKSSFQAIRVDYEEDCLNERFSIWVYPTSRHNDIDTMTIIVNEVGLDGHSAPYMTDILLNLYKENIETNRINIPFKDLFGDGRDTATVRFIVSGEKDSDYMIELDRTKLKPFYIKDISSLVGFAPNVPSGWTYPSDTNSFGQYTQCRLKLHGDRHYLFKLSSIGNVLFNGIKLHNIFDTFFYNDVYRMIVTSDTITALKKATL
jgi:hypothetical protein